jgi:hypothetical protein
VNLKAVTHPDITAGNAVIHLISYPLLPSEYEVAMVDAFSEAPGAVIMPLEDPVGQGPLDIKLTSTLDLLAHGDDALLGASGTYGNYGGGYGAAPGGSDGSPPGTSWWNTGKPGSSSSSSSPSSSSPSLESGTLYVSSSGDSGSQAPSTSQKLAEIDARSGAVTATIGMLLLCMPAMAAVIF